MSDGVASYLAHLGIEVTEDELAHYGKKGMKWGVRNDNRESSDSGSGGSRWTKDQKEKAKTIGKIAGIAAIGVGAFVAYNLVTSTAASDAFHAITSKGPKYGSAGQDAAKMAAARAKLAAGQKAAAATMAAKGNMKLPKLDPETAKFLKDGPARLLSDQKGWSEALGKSLGKIQAEDAKFISDYIANYVPKALGA